MACKEIMLLIITFFCFCASVSYTEITNLEQRLANMEQLIEDRLNTTERILGQFLTGRNDANLAALDVLSLRTGTINTLFRTCMRKAVILREILLNNTLTEKDPILQLLFGGGSFSCGKLI